ncbi:MAG: cellulose biosynthesis cyclic di-GMP-binding regulatory protein BcsB, partial [Nitrosomonas sp.]|nr:cellulose biosynthesis cyclic di-GMP-binding regulatory protein BcsB [Nitrosomonas sp.]MDP1950663.1 cellulose biosynthesis cyclic di-GMP-binding regulatory protein BcsB [Nitrosomonas sp.]
MVRLDLRTDHRWSAGESPWQQKASRRKNWRERLLGCLLCLLISLPAMAEEILVPLKKPGTALQLSVFLPAMAKEILIPLQKLTPHSMLQLKCITDERSIAIPIPERWDVKKATLNLNYISSISMIEDHSQLVIKINDVPIGQVKLNPLAPDALVAVNVPTQYLRPGYNKLSFAVAQHFFMKGCESPCAPDLWTNINMQNSSLQVEYEPNPVPLKLSAIAQFLFDPKIYPEARVNIITEDRSAENLTIAAIVASGIARRYDYRKVTFEVSQQIKPDMDNIVVGQTGFMRQFLQPFEFSMGEVKGGYLKIFPLPTPSGNDNTHALVVVSGEKFDHVKLAALTFSSISIAYPGTQELNAFEFIMPELAAYAGRDVIIANKTYDFKTLNLLTTTFQGMSSAVKEMSFRLPADMMIRQNYSAKLALSFAYGAGMRESSALNVLVNGIAVRAVGLNKQSGDYLHNYEIDLPAYLFKPGTNIITFAPELHPVLKECDLALVNNLFLSIFDNSTMTFPDMPHFVELPKLELLMLNGFPFTRWPDGYESMIYLVDPSNESIATALNLVGLMTQKNGFPMLSIQMGLQFPENWKGDLIIIGNQSKLPAELKEKSPLLTSNSSLIPYPVVRGWENETATLSLSRQTSSLGEGSGLLMQFESPWQIGRTVMTLSADTTADLLRLGETLLDPEVQAQIYGGMVLIEMTQTKPKVTSMNVGAKYTTGKKGDILWIDSFLYAYPYVYYALLGLLILGLAFIIYILLKRYRATRKLGEIQN